MNTPAPSTISTAAALGTIFAHMGQMADLQEVIIHTRSSLELYPPGHPDRSSPLANFAIVLHYHYSQTSQTVKLEEAIAHHRDPLELYPPRHPDRFISLNNLAGVFQVRFEYTGQMVDLEEAIIYHRSTLKLHPLGQPYFSSSLNSLAAALDPGQSCHGEVGKFGRAKDRKDLVVPDIRVIIMRSSNPCGWEIFHQISLFVHTHFLRPQYQGCGQQEVSCAWECKR